jgi:hypothetical protein
MNIVKLQFAQICLAQQIIRHHLVEDTLPTMKIVSFFEMLQERAPLLVLASVLTTECAKQCE